MIDYRDRDQEAALTKRLHAQDAASNRPAVDVEICIFCLGVGEVLTPKGSAMCGGCQGTGEE